MYEKKNRLILYISVLILACESSKEGRKKKVKKLILGRKARTNFKDLANAVTLAPVIEGVIMHDDDSDKVIHRNGRFINNVFVGDEDKIQIPDEITVTADIGGRKKG